MTDRDFDRIDPLDAGLQNTMSGVLLTRALRERRDAIDRITVLEGEIDRLRRIEQAARPLARRTYVDDVVAHVPYDDVYRLRLVLFGSDEAIPAGLAALEEER